MSELAMKAASMLDMLPEQEQALAFEMLRRIVLAWDPDFTKTTPAEDARIEAAEAEIAVGDFKDASEIDWNSEN